MAKQCLYFMALQYAIGRTASKVGIVGEGSRNYKDLGTKGAQWGWRGGARYNL